MEADQTGSQPAASASGSVPISKMLLGKHSARGLIKRRPSVGLVHLTALSLLFAMLATPIILADQFAGQLTPPVVGETVVSTIRVSTFAGFRGTETHLSSGGIVAARGEPIDAELAAVLEEVLAARPSGLTGWLAVAIGMFVLCGFFSAALRSRHRGKLVRNQLVIIALVLVGMLLAKVATMLTTISILAMPVAFYSLIVRKTIDRGSAAASGLFAAFAIASVVPFDPGVLTVLVVQAAVPVLVLLPGSATAASGNTKVRTLIAAAIGGCSAAIAFAAYAFLVWGEVPGLSGALGSDFGIWQTGLLAAAIGGIVSGPLVVALVAPIQVALGEITTNRLVKLADFSNPLLKQIAERSPGSWQHSVAMANMAETAAAAVGADGRLVRTGAYYHDLGKSLQPKYFIENLATGEPSPHDSLAPEVSADVIFAHVTEGVRVGRARGLPERIIDFMHMHHGDGRLEYFWSKCQEQGNPNGLSEDAFCYPGLRPQSKETAVLAIVDAVEAASRTLRKADEKNIRNLVQKIVYGKLHLGQLDESGLSMRDLRQISEALVTTIKHAHHGRIEYPWQKEAAQEEAALEAEQATRALRGPPRAGTQSDTGGLSGDYQLDSLDAPRSGYRSGERDARVESAAAIATGRQAPATAQTPAGQFDSSGSAPNAKAVSSSPPPSQSSEPASSEPASSEPASSTSEFRVESSDAERASSAQLDVQARRRSDTAPIRGQDGPSTDRKLPTAMVVDDVLQVARGESVDDSIDVEIRRKIEEQAAATASGSIPIVPNDSAIMDVQPAFEVDLTEPRVSSPSRGPSRKSAGGSLELFSSVIPLGRKRSGRSTGELLKVKNALPVLEPLQAKGRTEASVVSVAPGTMVVGPPPETHPRERSGLDPLDPLDPHLDKLGVGDQTVETKLPLPVESVPPNKRTTAERAVVPPPEAFPDDTEPAAAAIAATKDKPG